MLVRPRRQRGFTLIELMITIAVLVVVTLVAAPSFSQFMANQRVRNASFELMSALIMARSQAVTLNNDVSLKKKAGATNWDEGWSVADSTTTFATQEALRNLKITDSENLSAITYGRDGRVDGATEFTIEPVGEMSGVSKRCISIDLGGKPFSKQGSC